MMTHQTNNNKTINIYQQMSIVHFLFIIHVDRFFCPRWEAGVAVFSNNNLLFKYECVLNEKVFFVFKRKRKCIVEFIYYSKSRSEPPLFTMNYYEKTGKHGTKMTNITLNEKLERAPDLYNYIPLNIRTFDVPWLFSKRGKEVLTQISRVVDQI